MPTASDEKGEHLAAFLNQEIPGCGARYRGPDEPSSPHLWNFELEAVGKTLAIDERVYEAWPTHKEMLERVFAHYGLLDELRGAGPGAYKLVREGSKVKMQPANA